MEYVPDMSKCPSNKLVAYDNALAISWFSHKQLLLAQGHDPSFCHVNTPTELGRSLQNQRNMNSYDHFSQLNQFQSFGDRNIPVLQSFTMSSRTDKIDFLSLKHK